MLKFETNGKLGKCVITLPTQLNEITSDYLSNITRNIGVANNYSLIAICHKEKLSAFVLAGRNKKSEMTTAVVPIFVKRGNLTDDKFVGSPTNFNELVESGTRLLITPTAISMGLHVNVPGNDITMGKFMAAIDGDGYAYQNASKHNENVYFIEFKLIPNCDILGAYLNKNDIAIYNPFAITRVDDEAV